jgi:hypothetical protein
LGLEEPQHTIRANGDKNADFFPQVFELHHPNCHCWPISIATQQDRRPAPCPSTSRN